uniref:CAZy families GH18 protein n=1 Tax=uncultured Thermanaerovibrio sp. TaxID=860788 RepID=A0A060CI06_9BACT|nr:CAZy families GH18 protein [uncultured Thermanaerovibrio sp.]
MAAYADFYGWDGYNVDFENMDPRDKDLFTGFVEKLSQLLHKAGRTVSVDVTGIVDNSPFWSGCYDRKALAEKLIIWS